MQYLQNPTQPRNIRGVSKDSYASMTRIRSNDQSPTGARAVLMAKASPRVSEYFGTGGEIDYQETIKKMIAPNGNMEDREMHQILSKAPAVPAVMFKPNSIKVMNEKLLLQKLESEK